MKSQIGDCVTTEMIDILRQLRTNTRIEKKLELSENLTIAPLLSFFFRERKTKTGNNPKLDLVHVDVHTKFGLILSISSQDIEQKQDSEVNQGS